MRTRRSAFRHPYAHGAIVATFAAVAALALAPVGPAGAFKVVEHEEATGGGFPEVTCGQPTTETWGLPEGASNVELLEPRVGQLIEDGFGEEVVGTVESIAQRTEAERPVFEITAVGSHKACEPFPGSSSPPTGSWRTNGVDFRATYDLVSHPKVLLSDDQAGLHARQRPARITATADAGWRDLRWKGWGKGKAVAEGKFYGVRAVAMGYHDADLRTFSYPVRVTVSRIRLCGADRYYYTKIKTSFEGNAPAEIRRQAKPPGTADCLD